jgi:hypothetical protein
LQKVLFSNSGFWNDMLAVGGLRKVRNFPAGDLVSDPHVSNVGNSNSNLPWLSQRCPSWASPPLLATITGVYQLQIHSPSLSV